MVDARCVSSHTLLTREEGADGGVKRLIPLARMMRLNAAAPAGFLNEGLVPCN